MHSDPRHRLLLTQAAVVLGLALCSLFAARCQAADEQPDVTVSDAWIRWLPGGLPAGGYVTLRNGGARPQTFTGASSPDYGEISLHRSVSRAGVSTMEPVARLAVPARTSVNFAARGYHIMLEHPTRPLQPGDRVPMTLHFSDGSSTTVLFEVRRPDAVGAAP